MGVGKLAIALIVIFVLFVVALAGELLYVIWRHRSFLRRSSPPIHRHNVSPSFSLTEAATKELLYFFGLKPHIQVELDTPAGASAGAPNKDGSSPDDHVVDVFKLFDAKRQSRFLATNKEVYKEEVELKPDVDFSNKPAVTVAAVESLFSTPCDSPTFFTPVGSPSREAED